MVGMSLSGFAVSLFLWCALHAAVVSAQHLQVGNAFSEGVKISSSTYNSECNSTYYGTMVYDPVLDDLRICLSMGWMDVREWVSNDNVIAALPGLSEATAAPTCRHIRAASVAPPSGLYWINPTGSSAFKAYCDMETDGGGWTRVAYAQDLAYAQHFSGADEYAFLPSDFQLLMPQAQILALQGLSTEGRQRYVGLCNGVIHHWFNSSDAYTYSFGFRFVDGHVITQAQTSFPEAVITHDGCAFNDEVDRQTVYEFSTVHVPITNVNSRDHGNTGEIFGSPLTENPAWLR